jgi:hypothetical protein
VVSISLKRIWKVWDKKSLVVPVRKRDPFRVRPFHGGTTSSTREHPLQLRQPCEPAPSNPPRCSCTWCWRSKSIFHPPHVGFIWDYLTRRERWEWRNLLSLIWLLRD